MAPRTVKIKVREDVARVADELVELGIAKSRNHAYIFSSRRG